MDYAEKIEVAKRMVEPYVLYGLTDKSVLYLTFPSEAVADEWEMKLCELGLCLVEKLGANLLFYAGGPEDIWQQEAQEVIREWKSKSLV